MRDTFNTKAQGFIEEEPDLGPYFSSPEQIDGVFVTALQPEVLILPQPS